MPVSHKLPQWEGEENRVKIVLALLKQPMTPTELIKETGLVKSTVHIHLNELQRSRTIMKTIRETDGKPAYTTTADERILASELKLLHYDVLMGYLSQWNPALAKLLEAQLEALTRVFIHFSKRRATEQPPIMQHTKTVKDMVDTMKRYQKGEIADEAVEIKEAKTVLKETLRIIDSVIHLEDLVKLRAEVEAIDQQGQPEEQEDDGA